MEYRYGSHTIYNIDYFVRVTKYRYKVLTGELGMRIWDLVPQSCEALARYCQFPEILGRPIPKSSKFPCDFRRLKNHHYVSASFP